MARLWNSALEGRRRRKDSPAPAPRPDAIIIGGKTAKGADCIVPDYIPVHKMDWSNQQRHTGWPTLAAHAKGRCIVLDEAGHYASGFIPEVVLEDATQLRASP